MRWETDSAEQRRARMLEWHEWFAWKPVHIKKDGTLQWVWLETIYRRLGRDIGNRTWQYCFDDFEMIKLADEEAKQLAQQVQQSQSGGFSAGSIWVNSGGHSSGHSGILGGPGSWTVTHTISSSTPTSGQTIPSQSKGIQNALQRAKKRVACK